MASDPLHFQLPHLNHHVILPVPRLLGNLLANVLTQYVCISGVNQLAAKTNSLSVSITLNIRKLASLLLSILFYGSIPNAGVLAGAAVVFYGAYVYG